MTISQLFKNQYKKVLVDFNNSFCAHPSSAVSTDNPYLQKINEFALKKTDISDHLATLFLEALTTKGQLVVELGTRGGDSTFALSKVVELTKGMLVSVDIEEQSGVRSYDRWQFVKSDDIAFAGRFEAWAGKNKLQPKIDFLFIDTSHEYEHTKQEIQAWLPFVSDQGKVAFHDTNMQEIYSRKDGSKGHGWNNQRGVIRAIEEFLEVDINEKESFQTIIQSWMVSHWPNCNGLTLLEKISKR